ncbi:MAG: VWA domain-containing protein [Bryobacteraceae bacterium]
MRKLAMVMALWLGVTAAQEPVIRGGVALVDLLVTVRDKKGGLVKDLKQSDFKVFEDGKQQEIRGFAHDLDVPLTVGMLIDISGSVAKEVLDERAAARQFFQQVLREQDKAFVISFARDAELLQDTTNSLEKLRRALDEIQPPDPIVNLTPNVVFAQFPMPGTQRRRPPIGGGRGPTGRGGPGGRVMMGGTVLYDAVFLASDEVLRPVDGRKAIILITDGQDQGSRVSLNTALEMAQKYNVIVYSIQVRSAMGRNVPQLDTLSTETGGKVYKLDKNLDKIFKNINEELRSQYSVSYVPSEGGRPGAYHQIEVQMANKSLKAQARKGYYSAETKR